MKQNANLARVLAGLRDIHAQPVILSTDGHRVRLLIHERCPTEFAARTKARTAKGAETLWFIRHDLTGTPVNKAM